MAYLGKSLAAAGADVSGVLQEEKEEEAQEFDSREVETSSVASLESASDLQRTASVFHQWCS